jgi:hypothetical protein
MTGILLVIYAVALAGLVTGLIRPNWVSLNSRKSVLFTFGAATAIVGLFVVSAATATPPTTSNASSTAASQQAPVAASSTPKTEDELITEAAQSALNSADVGATKVTYKGVQIEKADSDRPAGSKMITVSYSIADFFDKSSLINSTGKLSSAAFRNVFAENPNIYDVIVWYYGDTKDRYGNAKNDVILTYTMDRPTLNKINWNGFDEEGLCDFLTQEDHLTGNNLNTACNTLVNIQ